MLAQDEWSWIGKILMKSGKSFCSFRFFLDVTFVFVATIVATLIVRSAFKDLPQVSLSQIKIHIPAIN